MTIETLVVVVGLGLVLVLGLLVRGTPALVALEWFRTFGPAAVSPVDVVGERSADGIRLRVRNRLNVPIYALKMDGGARVGHEPDVVASVEILQPGESVWVTVDEATFRGLTITDSGFEGRLWWQSSRRAVPRSTLLRVVLLGAETAAHAELPEVETVARDLRGLVVGSTILGARCDWPRTLRNVDPEAFARGVTGCVIEGVGRRGKQLLVELSGGAVMTIHLKMTGQLFVVPVGTPADRHVHLVLDLDGDRELRFRDIRKFGRVGLYPRDELTGEALAEPGGAAVFGDHGPEPLADDFTLRQFRRVIRSRRGRLKTLLMDQRFLAGIGNIYADEALWRAKLHPLRSAGSLRPADERRLYLAIRDVLAEAVERRGSSIDDYTAPEGDGGMQERLQVYQRGRAVPALRPPDQADRRRRTGHAFLLVVPAAAHRRTGSRR